MTTNARRRPDAEAESFRCARCGDTVSVDAYGTQHRNHCPRCLWSLHVDDRPGDRASGCGGRMEPIAIWVRDDEWVLVHRCQRCEALRPNRIAGDDSPAALLALAARALANPPFPLDRPMA
ncbi:MAG: RNHCP domain-containing protein [Chloroflexota bacterium]|nr:RNHCP domain-containing protein [Chloroflexota bacterium]